MRPVGCRAMIDAMGEVHDIETGQRIRTPVLWRAVVGMNGSAESKRALRQAVAMCIPAAAVVLVDVVSSNGSLQPPAAVRKLALEELEDASALVAGGRAVLTRLRTGHPAEVLANEAADADLLAVGTCRLGHRGEIIHELVASTPCPLLIARSDRALPALVGVDTSGPIGATDVAEAVAARTGAELTALVDTRAELVVVPAGRVEDVWSRRFTSLLVVPEG
jgi:Universal stress protein family